MGEVYAVKKQATLSWRYIDPKHATNDEALVETLPNNPIWDGTKVRSMTATEIKAEENRVSTKNTALATDLQAVRASTNPEIQALVRILGL